MFVRFLGSGVGHKATNSFTSSLRPEFDKRSTFEMNDGGIDDGPEKANEEDEEKDDEAGMDSEDEDWGYKSEILSVSEDDEEGEGGWEDEDSGAEDGEEPWGMGDDEAEGYAEL